MKKSLFFFFVLMLGLSYLSQSQTLVFRESFDPPSNADSVTASGAANNFAINSRLFFTGTQCDSTLVTPNDTAWLTTNSFSTVGLPFVFLSFSHICKIELNDGGEVEVSVNNGPWVKLTGSEYNNPGNSQFVNNGNKFNANTYPLEWLPLQALTKPTQTWWKTESFNLSTLAGNQANVRVRFSLRDGNGNGAGFNHGWYIDNIRITAAISELTPPTITLIPTIYQDTVLTTGFFEIKAHIKDPSGIDTAYLAYKVNNGVMQYVPVNWVSDSTYKGIIPSYTYTNRIDYTLFAADNSASHNVGSVVKWFYIKKPSIGIVVGSGTSASSNLPVNGQFNWGWGYMIYKVNELNFSGKIDSVSFYVNNTVPQFDMINQRIFLGHTGSTSFGATQPDTTFMTKVFHGNLSFTGPGWFRIKLTTPFIYNGINNLCLYWVNKDGANVTGYPLFRYTPTTSNNCAYNHNNTFSSVFPTSSGTQTLNRPNLRLAYFNQPLPKDAGVTLISSPTGVVEGINPLPIKVYLKNYGSDTLKNATVKWMLDGVYQDSINWVGALPEAVVSSELTIDNSTFTQGQHTIKAWTVKPNGIVDPNKTNDTATMTFYSCDAILSGNYTIGPTGNYPTINAALAVLQNCGISGPVVFNIQNGTYTGQITIPPITGTSATNTITFQSLSGNSADVTIQYAASATTDNWVVRLNGSDYIIFKNLTIKSTTANNFGRVVELINGANYNKFEGNTIQSVVSTNTGTAGIYSAATASDNFNTFLNNKIQNGYYGVYYYGSATNKKAGMKFIGNEITGWYYYGMYLYYNDSVQVIKNTVINGPASATSYHIYISNNGYGCKVMKNNVQISSSGTSQGITITAPISNALTPNIIANNFVSQSIVSSQASGIYLSAANFTNIYYNSVNITGTSTSGRCFYTTGGTTEINIINNIFSNTGGGYSIYVATTTPVNKCDYNDLYATGTNLGYWTANRANFAAWKAASLKDSNSVSGNPQFLSTTNLHTFSPVILYKGKPLALITDDIDDQARSLLLPSIGADETQKLDYDIALDSIINPKNSCQLTSAEQVKVRIRNKGLNPMSNLTVYYQINNNPVVQETYTGTIDTSTSIIYTFNTTANLAAPGNYLFKFYVSHPQDMSALNDSINNIWVNGEYDLNAASYTMSFEQNENFSDWSIVNTDNSTYKWIVPFVNTTFAKTGTNSAQLFNNAANLGEDWMFSRCFNLIGGKTYSVSFWYRAGSASPVQTITLKYGSAQNQASMTNTLLTLPGVNNTTYVQAIGQFVVPTTGTYYFGWQGNVGMSNNLYIDDINIKSIPDQEATVNAIRTPNTGCQLTSSEVVKIRIKNTGGDTIQGNLTAYFKLDNGAVQSAPVNAAIIPGDTTLFTFPQTVNLQVTNQDVIFSIKAWISLTGDPIQNNDTLSKQIISRHSPAPPTVTGATVSYGSSATLQATAPYNILWYNDLTSPSFYQGSSYTTPILFDTTTYYVATTNDLPGFDKQIGNGTTTSSLVPTYGYYDYSWSSVIYTASELNISGIIDTLSYYVNNTSTGYLMNAQKIYMRHVSYGTHPNVNDPDYANMTLVFQGNITWTGPGWFKIALQAPFNYNGTDNLEVAWQNNDGAWVTGYPVFRQHTAPANMVKYDYQDGSFPTGAGTYTTSRPNTRFISKSIPGCPSAKIPVTATVIIPAKEIEVEKIITPVDNCTFGTEIVKAKFFNNGNGTINPPFTAGYFVSGNPVPVTEQVNVPIASGDSLIYTFTTPAVTNVTSGNMPFTFKVFASVSGDPWPANDTLSKTVTLSFSPADPVCSDATIPYGTSAALSASASAPIYWFTQPSGGSSIATGNNFNTPNLYSNTTYYLEANTTIPGFTVQVGTGSQTTSNVPINGQYDYGWTSSLYLATDLNLMGRIDTIMFYANNSMSAFQMLDQRIYMKHVTYNTLPNLNMPNTALMTKVFQGNISWSGPGWNKIVLTTPFYYNGVDNLELTWENWDGGNVSGFPVFNTSTVTGNMVKYNHQNSSFPTTAGAWIQNRPNIKIYSVGFGCPSHRVPVNVTVTGLPPVDAGLISFDSPTSPTSLGNKPIKVILKNFGSDTLFNVQINLKINGISQATYPWTGALPTNQTDTVTITNYNFTYIPYPAQNFLIAWTQNPNGQADPTTVNDTISKTIYAYNPLSGIYFIRTSDPDFNSFNDALLALNAWGVGGVVTIIADTGTYNEKLSVGHINGTSATNTVTFQSITGNNNDVLVYFAPNGSANNYVVQLNGADWVNFKNITFENQSANSYGRVVEIKNASTNNRFEGNKLIGLQITTNNSSPVYCIDINSENNTFAGNTMKYGFQSAYVYGSSTNKIRGFKFINNNFIDYYQYGVNLSNNDSVFISGNTFSTTSAAANNYGIYALSCDKNSRFEKNNITYNGNGNFYGIYLANTNTSSTLNSWIVNNFVSNSNSAGTSNGIHLDNNNYLNVYYNSVNINQGNTTLTRALYQTGGTSNLNIKNNNLANNAGGYAYYINSPGGVNITDYNNFYTNGLVLSYWTGDNTNLASLQALSSKDVHSKSVNPGYITSTNLHTFQFALINSGNPVPGITTDIDGDTRNSSTPCIGADEINPSPLDAGITLINAPGSPALSGIQPLKVTVANYGTNNINNATIKYSVNGVLAGTFNWVPSTPLTSFDTVMMLNVGNINLPAGNTIIKVWTSLPNGLADNVPVNDTATLSVIVCGGPLSGTYTIGGINPSYYSFADALVALNNCGIGGPVTFNVASGTYNERLNIGPLTGASAVNTVTFQSASGVNTSVTLQASGTSAADNYVIQLNGAKFIKFKNMTIKATTPTTFGRVVCLINNADGNTFEGNKIQSLDFASVTPSTNAAAVYSTGGNIDNNSIINNEIIGGYYGIYWYGASANLNKSNRFDNNLIKDWYYYGAYMYYNDSVIFRSNTTRSGSVTNNAYHVYAYYCHNGSVFEKNKLYGNNSGSFYGLSLNSCNGTAAEPNLIINNMISHVNGVTTAYGINLSGTTYTELYYNTVNINGGSSTAARALYTNTGSNLKLLNNNFVAYGPGYAYYINTSSAIVQSDYNNYYTTSSVFANWNGSVADLAALQAVNSMDVHSVSNDPVFVSATDLHATAVGIDGKAIPVAGITTDIDGDSRNATIPDIGADEFNALPFDVAVVDFVSPATISNSSGSSVSVTITLRNFGSSNATSIPVRYKYGSGSVVSATWTGVLLPNQTANYTFTTPFTTLSGTSSLCAYTAMTTDQNIHNDTLCMNFTGVPVLLVPNCTDFESNNYFYSSGTNSSWEFGTPAATTINSAHSPVNAWATNLDGYYNNGESSYLYTPFYNFGMVSSATLEFWHWYSTEQVATGDGGRIKYSLNGGATWITLGFYPNDPAGTNWYNANIGGKPSWSGSSSGWIQSTYDLSTIPAIVNATSPVQFMFEFESNGTNANFDGWAIDDICITAPPIAKDAGVVGITAPSGSTQAGSQVTVEVAIQNFGTTTLTSIPVKYAITSVVSETWTGSLAPGGVTNYTFTTTYTSPGNTYNLCAFTLLTGDTYWNNDTTCASITTTAANTDVGILNIIKPSDTLQFNTQDSVIVTIKNFGLTTVTSIPISYNINGGLPIGAGNWTGTLNAGQTVVYKFSTLFTAPLGNFQLCAKTQLSGDMNSTNDQLCEDVYGKPVGIDDYENANWELMQNVPNPGINLTRIGFTIPNPGKVKIEIFDLLGNVRLIDENEYPAGKNNISFDISSLPAGIYFYSATYSGIKKTKRMIVTK